VLRRKHRFRHPWLHPLLPKETDQRLDRWAKPHISGSVQLIDSCGILAEQGKFEGPMPDQMSAWELILSGDAALFAIVGLSLAVSLSAVVLAALAGMPLGALLALTRFPGRSVLVVVLNALMGLPPVVVGLAVYLLLSRSGPLGGLGILFTPTAMVIAQTILIVPIIAALTRQTVEDLWAEYRDELTAMDVGPAGRVATLLWDARFSLLTALLAGFGRAAAEVGAVMIVGGNIDGFTRTMTTAVALETSKGNLPLAMGLGLILVAIVLAINAAAWGTRVWSERQAG
jgi:tungstate transport system permease protein